MESPSQSHPWMCWSWGSRGRQRQAKNSSLSFSLTTREPGECVQPGGGLWWVLRQRGKISCNLWRMGAYRSYCYGDVTCKSEFKCAAIKKSLNEEAGLLFPGPRPWHLTAPFPCWATWQPSPGVTAPQKHMKSQFSGQNLWQIRGSVLLQNTSRLSSQFPCCTKDLPRISRVTFSKCWICFPYLDLN